MGRPGCGCCIECATTYKVDKDTGYIEWAKNLGVNTLAITNSDDRIYVSLEKQLSMASDPIKEEGQLLGLYFEENLIGLIVDDVDTFEVGDILFIPLLQTEINENDEQKTIQVGALEVEIISIDIENNRILTDEKYDENIANLLINSLPYAFVRRTLFSIAAKYDIVVLDMGGKIKEDECISVLPNSSEFTPSSSRFTKLYLKNKKLYGYIAPASQFVEIDIETKKITSVIYNRDGTVFSYSDGKIYTNSPPTSRPLEYLVRHDDGFETIQVTKVNQFNAEHKEEFDIGRTHFYLLSGNLENIIVYDFEKFDYFTLKNYSGEHYKYTIEQTEQGARLKFDEEMLDTVYPVQAPIISVQVSGLGTQKDYYQALDNSRILKYMDPTKETYEGSLTINKTISPGPLYQSLQDNKSRNFPGYGYRIVDLENKTFEYDYMDDPQLDIEYKPFEYTFTIGTALSGTFYYGATKTTVIENNGQKQDKITYSVDDLVLVKNFRQNDLTQQQVYDLIIDDIAREPLNASTFQIGTHFMSDNIPPKEIEGKLRQNGLLAVIYPIFYDALYDRIDYPNYKRMPYEISLTTESIAAKLEGHDTFSPFNICVIEDGIQGYELFKYKVLYGYYIRYFDSTIEYDIGSKNFSFELKGEANPLKALAGNNLIAVMENGDTPVDQNNIFNLVQDVFATTGIGVWVKVNYYDYYYDLRKDKRTPLKHNTFVKKGNSYINIENTDNSDLLVNADVYVNRAPFQYLDRLQGGYDGISGFGKSLHYSIPSWSLPTIEFERNRIIIDKIKQIYNTSQLKLDFEDIGPLYNKYIEKQDSGVIPVNSRSEIIYVDDKDYIITDSYDGDRVVSTTSIKFYTVVNNDVMPIESTVISLSYPYTGTNARTKFDWTCPIGYFETYTKSGLTDTLYYSGVPLEVDINTTTASGPSGLVQLILDSIENEEKPEITILKDGPLVSGEITLLIDNTGKEFTLAENEFHLNKRLILKTGTTNIEPGAFIAKTNPINDSFFSGAFNYEDKVIGYQYPNTDFNMFSLVPSLTTGTRSLFETADTNCSIRSRTEDQGTYSGIAFVDFWQYKTTAGYENPIWPGWQHKEGGFTVNTIDNSTLRNIAKIYLTSGEGFSLEIFPPVPREVSGNAQRSRHITSEAMMTTGLEPTENRYNTYISQPAWDGISDPFIEAGLQTINGTEYFNNAYNGVTGAWSRYAYYITGRAFSIGWEEKSVPSGGVRVIQNATVSTFDPTVEDVNREGWVLHSIPANTYKLYTTIIGPKGGESTTTGGDRHVVTNGPFTIGLDGDVYTSGIYDKKISIQEVWYDKSEIGRPLRLSYKDTPPDSPNIEKFYSFVYEEIGTMKQFASHWIINLGGFIDEERGFEAGLIFGGEFENGKAIWNGEEFFDINNIATEEYHDWNLVSCDFADSDNVLEDYGESSGTAIVYCGKKDGQTYSYKYRYRYEKLTKGEDDIETIMSQRFAYFKDNAITDFILGPILENPDLIGWGSGAYCPYPTDTYALQYSGYVHVPSGQPQPITGFGFYSMNNIGPIPNVSFDECHIIGFKESGLISKTLSRSYNSDPEIKDQPVNFKYIENSPHPTRFWAFAISGAFQELIVPDEAKIIVGQYTLKNSGSIYENQKFNILAFNESGIAWKSNYLMNPRKYNSFMEEHMQWNDYDHDKLIKDVSDNKEYLFLTGEKRKKIVSVTRSNTDRNNEESILRNNYCGEDIQSENLKITDPEYRYILSGVPVSE